MLPGHWREGPDMGAFGKLFGFDGRISRLGYLGRGLAAAIGVIVLATGGGAALVFVVRPTGLGGFESGAQWLTIAIILLWLWSSFALATRRLRDMGLEPTHIVPLYGAFWVVGVGLLTPLSRFHPESFGVMETTWMTLQGAAMIPLLLWPSRQSQAELPTAYEPPQPTAYMNWRDHG
jgi:uncharacterized membrane protein YhaH (DUF805 family)